MLNNPNTVKSHGVSSQTSSYIEIPHCNGSFSADKNFSMDAVDGVRPPISRIHENFEWFEGLREKPLQAGRLTYQNIRSDMEISLASVLPRTYLYQVHYLMQVQRIGVRRPLSYKAPNIFLVLDAGRILREFQLLWWQNGWSIDPEVLGKKPLPIGSRLFSELPVSPK